MTPSVQKRQSLAVLDDPIDQIAEFTSEDLRMLVVRGGEGGVRARRELDRRERAEVREQRDAARRRREWRLYRLRTWWEGCRVQLAILGTEAAVSALVVWLLVVTSR